MLETNPMRGNRKQSIHSHYDNVSNKSADDESIQPALVSPSWILYLLRASVGVAMIGLGIIWPLVPVYAVDLGAGGFQVGLIIASFNLARVFSNPFAGRLSDRWGRKPFIVAGLVLYALISLLYVLANGIGSLILVRMLHGLTSVLVVPVAMALAADIAPKKQLGLYLGTLNMAVMLGLGVGPVLGGTIRDFFGMNAAFYSMGILALFTLVGVALLLPGGQRETRSQRAQPIASFSTLMRHKIVQGLFLVRFFTASGQGCVYTFLPILALQIQLSSSQVGVILGVNIFLIASLQRLCGRAADRLNPLHLIITGTFISGLAVLGMPFVEGFPMILFLNMLMGMGNGIAMPGGLVLTGHLGKTVGTGTAMGITDSGWSLGMIVSPIMSGIIMDSLGVSSIFFVGGILIITGTVLIYFFLKGYDPLDHPSD